MKRADREQLSGYECEICHYEFPFVLACGERFLCTQCFTAENNRFEEEYGRFQEDYETFLNE